jgi:hypothetical protein
MAARWSPLLKYMSRNFIAKEKPVAPKFQKTNPKLQTNPKSQNLKLQTKLFGEQLPRCFRLEFNFCNLFVFWCL